MTTPETPIPARASWRWPLAALAAAAAALAACFSGPLIELVDFSMGSDFFSYIPLMPAITGYLIWLRRGSVGPGPRPAWGAGLLAAGAGGAILAGYALALHEGWHPMEEGYLDVMTLSFLLMLLGASLAALGTGAMGALVFPVSLLVFMLPCPEHLKSVIENFFQQTSASTAYGLFKVAGTVVMKDGLDLALPQVHPYPNGRPFPALNVAPECSGIHSSLVLLITSLIAGHLFLRCPWKRAALAVFVVPLAIARNGFRIFVIGELCVHVGPEMIDSPIHHHGGPIFFALSLIPFFFVLAWLRKTESNGQNAVKSKDN